MWVSVKGYICTIMELSMNQYTTILVVLPEMQHLKAATCTASLMQFIRGVLTMDQMAGTEPFN